jgi:hypothetical protein
MDYSPPSPEDLRRFKDETGMTGEQLAELFGLAGGQQWRKYTGGAEPREMSVQMLFFGAARLVLDEKSIGHILDQMRAIGGEAVLGPAPVNGR